MAVFQFLVLPGLIMTAIVGTVHLIFPAAAIFLFLAQARRPYRACVDAVEWLWLSGASALLERCAGVNICTSGDDAPCRDRVVLIVLNHHCRLDWMFFWPIAHRLRLLSGGALKIALKENLRRAPFFGWAMQAFLFIFLRRNDRDGDLARLRASAEHAAAHGDRYALLIFPEGTDLSPSNVKLAQTFAEQKGKAAYTHVLYPRAAGFCEAMSALGGALDAVYDVTIRYDNHPKVVASDDARPNEGACLFHGHWPTHVHCHIERVGVTTIVGNAMGGHGVPKDPLAITERSAAWLQEAWARKEARLAASASAAASSAASSSASSAAATYSTASSLSRPVATEQRGVLAFWAALIAALAYALCYGFGAGVARLSWLYTIVGAYVLAAMTKRAGLDGAEYAAFPAATVAPTSPQREKQA